MDKKQKAKFQKKISVGKWEYILLRGVLLWGIPCATLMLLFYRFVLHVGLSWGFIIFNYAVILIGGFVYGLCMWQMMSQKLESK